MVSQFHDAKVNLVNSPMFAKKHPFETTFEPESNLSHLYDIYVYSQVSQQYSINYNGAKPQSVQLSVLLNQRYRADR